MTINEFHDYINDLNNLFHSHWIFMNGNHPDQWPLEMDKDDWIEQFIAYMDNDNNDKD
jgi:hypothetical protein